jgi:complex iron-sulfur molybdoenzyme family reductase subunit gamma
MTAVLAVLLAAGAAAPDASDRLRAASAEVIQVVDAPAPLPTDPAAPLWDRLPLTAFVAAPQVSVRLPDREANAALATAPNRPVRVGAATDGVSLAVLVAWPDPTEDRASADRTDAFGDAAALQLPLEFGAGKRLPYVGMGDEQAKVAVFLARAGAKETVFRQAVGAGFGTLARADLGGVEGGLARDASGKGWRALFVRPLAAGGLDLRRGLVPFAVAIWDGGARERGGNKALTGWKLLRLPRYPVDGAYAAELAWGFGPGDLGDAGKGKELFEGACTACHSAGALRAAPGLAPDLSRIGVIATPSYLRESIVAPSAVIVPTPNLAQRQDRAAKLPKGAAWPADDAYAWSRVEPDGKRTSSMPDFSSLPDEDVRAIVAHLRTLGVEPSGPGSGGAP